MQEPWRIELFGGLRAVQAKRSITRFQSRQTGLLLAYLAYHRRRAVPREELIELLWPECDLDQGRHRLSQALSSLRHQLEPPGVPAGAVLLADRQSVRLNPPSYVTDVARFEDALQRASKAASRRDRIHALKEAAELYRGELLPGFYEEWCLAQREALREQYLQALRQLVEALEEDGELEAALGYALRAVSADPLREETHLDLMRLYAATDQPAAALRQYGELERVLQEDLGDAPSMAARRLAEEIRLAALGSQKSRVEGQEDGGSMGPGAGSDAQPSTLNAQHPTPNTQHPAPNPHRER